MASTSPTRTAEVIYTSLLTSSASDVTGQYLVDGGVTANLTGLDDGSSNGTTNGRDIEALKLANQCVLMVTLGLTMVGMGAAIEPKDFKIVVSKAIFCNTLLLNHGSAVVAKPFKLSGQCRTKLTNKLAKHFPRQTSSSSQNNCRQGLNSGCFPTSREKKLFLKRSSI